MTERNMLQSTRVLYLITELNVIGGAELLLPRFLEHLDRSSFSPIVASLSGADSQISDELLEQGVQVVDLGMKAKWRLDALYRLYRLFRKERPEILHCSLYHANIVGRLIGRLARIPVIISWRHSVNIGGDFRELVNRLTVGLVDKVIAVCELVRQAEIRGGKSPEGKVITVYNGIDVEKYSGNTQTALQVRNELEVPPDALILGAIGRFGREKNFTNLLTAMAIVRESLPSTCLLLVGDGELRGQLEAQVESLGIAEAVRFVGLRADIPDLLAAMDCFVLPSLWEGLPLVILEAMASALPVVATSVGGVPELVVDGITGLLVPPQEPDRLAQAIIRILKDSKMQRQMGEAGNARVKKHFHIKDTVCRIETIYHQLLQERLGGG